MKAKIMMKARAVLWTRRSRGLGFKNDTLRSSHPRDFTALPRPCLGLNKEKGSATISGVVAQGLQMSPGPQVISQEVQVVWYVVQVISQGVRVVWHVVQMVSEGVRVMQGLHVHMAGHDVGVQFRYVPS
jgi:hypothetical protein